jgi:hypothetical protein
MDVAAVADPGGSLGLVSKWQCNQIAMACGVLQSNQKSNDYKRGRKLVESWEF